MKFIDYEYRRSSKIASAYPKYAKNLAYSILLFQEHLPIILCPYYSHDLAKLHNGLSSFDSITIA